MNKHILLLLSALGTYGLHASKKKDPYNCKKKKDWIQASRFAKKDERTACYERRVAAACMRDMMVKDYCITCEENGDEKAVPHFAAKYSKGLPHGTDGILTCDGQQSYKKMVKAVNNGCQETYNSISLAPDSVRKLVSPQGSATFGFMGGDSAMTRLPSFPKLCSTAAAAQLLEVYLLAIARDVFFEEYGTAEGTDKDTDGGSITRKAAKVLTALSPCYEGPVTSTGEVTPQLLFRENNMGALYGPYISQFLYLPMAIPYGGFPSAVGVDNLPREAFDILQHKPIPGPRNFGITSEDFVAIQNGQVPVPYESSDYATTKRYLSTGRDLGGFVHFCYPFEPFYNALRVLAAHKFPFSPTSPYQDGSMKNEEAFANCGPIDASGLLGDAVQGAIKAAWAHKWRGNRVLRPEAFAGLAHLTKTSHKNEYGISEQIFADHGGINVLEWVKQINEDQGAGTYFLPLVYPEGSPQHPSYPQGHATISGACITILKALFDDQARIIDYVDPVKPDLANPTELVPYLGPDKMNMTVGSELDKLASNISTGRNFAGVHYRMDGHQGMLLGEHVAISLLQDHAACLTEQTFKGFELTKIDGTRIRITAKRVEEI